MNYQDLVFEKIKLNAGESKEYIDLIGETLNISKSAVYKRIKGDTMLSMDDLVRLMKAFDFSFDDIVYDHKKNIGFQFPYTDRTIKTFIDYIEPIKNLVTAANVLPDISLQYATNEFHFFLYMHDRDLTHFKLYMFAKTVWNLSAYKGRSFSLADFSEWIHIEKDIKLILNSYYKLPNVEIWNGNVLSNTLNQIKYALEIGYFEKVEDALVLCDKLDRMIDHVSIMAELGKKFLIGQNPDDVDTEITMYHNEITYTSNLMLLESPALSQIYFAFDNPNYIVSDDPKLVDYTHKWFDRIKKNALPISKSAHKTRKAYFSSIKRAIEQTRRHVEMHIENGFYQ
jgi:hypothetical protein